jgi:hypothetical protein
MFPALVRVVPLEKYKLWLVYTDGTQGILNLTYLAKKGIFKQWDDNDLFENVFLGETGAITWNEQLDICPDNAYLTLRGLSFDEWQRQPVRHHATD